MFIVIVFGLISAFVHRLVLFFALTFIQTIGKGSVPKGRRNNSHCLLVTFLSCVNLRDVHLNNNAVGVTLRGRY